MKFLWVCRDMVAWVGETDDGEIYRVVICTRSIDRCNNLNGQTKFNRESPTDLKYTWEPLENLELIRKIKWEMMRYEIPVGQA